jgi:hypothetical protein
VSSPPDPLPLLLPHSRFGSGGWRLIASERTKRTTGAGLGVGVGVAAAGGRRGGREKRSKKEQWAKGSNTGGRG